MCGELLVARQHSAPCPFTDARFSCALAALAACGFGAAADRMKSGMEEGSVLCNDEPGAVGTAATTIGSGQQPGGVIILSDSSYNCGDIAMQLLGEDGRRRRTPPGHEQEMQDLLACLNRNADPNQRPSKPWEHPG